jgi:RNA polymerase sigma-70 factor (ECF subfamily)
LGGTGSVSAEKAVSFSGMSDGLKKIVEDRDANAFRTLFLTFGPKVRAMLLRQGADCETAEDIVQDTMLTVWSKCHLFTPDRGALSSWIYAIARNLRIDRIRRQIVWEQFRGELKNLQDTQPAGDPELREPDRVHVVQALGALPAEQLEVIHLSFMEGLSQSEIADRLHVPLGTVKSRMRLAFGKLRCTVEDGA